MLLNILLLISFIYFLFFNYSASIFNLLLYFYGFKIDKKNCKKLPSKLILISSHTSMYDFFIGMAINYAIFHKNHSNYILMKKVFADICSPFLPFLDRKLVPYFPTPQENLKFAKESIDYFNKGEVFNINVSAKPKREKFRVWGGVNTESLGYLE